MDNQLKNMREMVQGLKDLSENMLNKTLTPDVLSKLSPKELDLIAEAKNALNFENSNPSEKLNNLNTILRKHGL